MTDRDWPIDLHRQHVERYLEVDRARAAVFEFGEQRLEHWCQLRWVVQLFGAQRDLPTQRQLVRQLVKMTQTLAQVATLVHARHDQHGDAVGPGLGHCRDDVCYPWAGDDKRNADLAARTGVAVGHEPCALFVARCHVADGAVAEPSIQVDGMHAGYAENGRHPLGLQVGDDPFADAQVRLLGTH